MKKKELRNVPLSDITPYPKKIHDTGKAVIDIKTSLQNQTSARSKWNPEDLPKEIEEMFDYIKISVVVDEDLQIICGQGVLQAMKALGWAKVPQVTQIIGMSEVLKREYRIADKKFDDPAFEVKDIAFDQHELDQMLHDLDGEDVREDDFDPDAIRETHIKPGDIYQLGPHRLMCADATKIEDIQQLTDGKRVEAGECRGVPGPGACGCMNPAVCEHQTCTEISGTDCRTSAGGPVMLHRHYACSTFYCPYPERMCGVRMQDKKEIMLSEMRELKKDGKP